MEFVACFVVWNSVFLFVAGLKFAGFVRVPLVIPRLELSRCWEWRRRSDNGRPPILRPMLIGDIGVALPVDAGATCSVGSELPKTASVNP